jgi:hypothetical protein
MKGLISIILAFLLIAVTGCSDDSPSGPGIPQETGINIVGTAPAFPATLKYYQTASNDRVSITFNYSIVEPEGARIWIQPVKKSSNATIYYSTSPVYKGSGSKTVIVSVSSDADTLHVSQLRVVIKTPDQSSTISEFFTDVDYTFSK